MLTVYGQLPAQLDASGMNGESQFQTSRLMLTTAILLSSLIAIVFVLPTFRRSDRTTANAEHKDLGDPSSQQVPSSAAVTKSDYHQPSAVHSSRPDEGQTSSSSLAAARRGGISTSSPSTESSIRPASARIVDTDDSPAHQAWRHQHNNSHPQDTTGSSNLARTTSSYEDARILTEEISLLRQVIDRFALMQKANDGSVNSVNARLENERLVEIQTRLKQLDEAINSLRAENRLTRDLVNAHQQLASSSIQQLKAVQNDRTQSVNAPTAPSSITLNIVTSEGTRVTEAQAGAALSVSSGDGQLQPAAMSHSNRPQHVARFAQRSQPGVGPDDANNATALATSQTNKAPQSTDDDGFEQSVSTQTVAAASDRDEPLPENAQEFSTLVIQPRGQKARLYQHYSVPDSSGSPDAAGRPDASWVQDAGGSQPDGHVPDVLSEPRESHGFPSSVPEPPSGKSQETSLQETLLQEFGQIESTTDNVPVRATEPAVEFFERQDLFPEVPTLPSIQMKDQSNAEQTRMKAPDRLPTPEPQSELAVHRLARTKQAETQTAHSIRPAMVPDTPTPKQIAESRERISRQRNAAAAKTPDVQHPVFSGVDMTVEAQPSGEVREAGEAREPGIPAVPASATDSTTSTTHRTVMPASERNQKIKQSVLGNSTIGPGGAVRFEHAYRFSSSVDVAPSQHGAPDSNAPDMNTLYPATDELSGMQSKIPQVTPSAPTSHSAPFATNAALQRRIRTASHSEPMLLPPEMIQHSVPSDEPEAEKQPTVLQRSMSFMRNRSWVPDVDGPRLPKMNLPDIRDIETPEWLQGRTMPNPMKSLRESKTVNRVSSALRWPGRPKTVE